MMCKVFVLILLVGLCGANGGRRYEDDVYGDIDRCKEGDKCDDGCDGDNCDIDNKKYLYEPCDYADDVDCVRKFFDAYGQCSVVVHEDKKPVYRERYIAYLPKINLTLIPTRARLTQLNGKIERFYINKKTGNLVIAVDFKALEINSKLGIFIVSRRGREPAVAKDRLNATFPVTLTAAIPVNEGITLKALKESRVTAFVQSGIIDFYIGPKVIESKDPAIAATVIGLLADIPTALQEIFLTEAPSFFLAYLQKYICDFGIPLSIASNLQGVH